MTNKKNLKNLKVGDEIVVYGIIVSRYSIPKSVVKKHLKIVELGHRNVSMSCYLLGKNGKIIRHRWFLGPKVIRLNLFEDYLSGVFGSNTMHFYLDPKIPCEMVIKNLKTEMRQINKRVMDCQRFMYQVEEK